MPKYANLLAIKDNIFDLTHFLHLFIKIHFEIKTSTRKYFNETLDLASIWQIGSQISCFVDFPTFKHCLYIGKTFGKTLNSIFSGCPRWIILFF